MSIPESTPDDARPEAESAPEPIAATDNGAETEAEAEAAAATATVDRSPFTARRDARRDAKEQAMGDCPITPASFRGELKGEIAVYFKKYRPQDQFEERQLEMAAIHGLRWLRLTDVRDQGQALRVRGALKAYDEAREDEVEDLALRLQTEPREALRRLERTSDGCDYLADAWAILAYWLALPERPVDRLGRRLLQLLGHDGDEPGAGDDPWIVRVWHAFRRLQADDATAADQAEARAFLAEVAAARYVALCRRGDTIWRDHDRQARAMAPLDAMVDHSPEGRQLARWIAEAERGRRRALEELSRNRRGAAEPRPTRRRPADPVTIDPLVSKAQAEAIATAAEAPRGRNEPGESAESTPSPTRNEPSNPAAPAHPRRNEPSDPASPTDPRRNEPGNLAVAPPPDTTTPASPRPHDPIKMNRRQRRALRKKQR